MESVESRRDELEWDSVSLSIRRQCVLLGLNRATAYYAGVGETKENLCLMRQIDAQYMKTPFFGSRRMTIWLSQRGYPANRKRIQRLMGLMNLEAIYPRPKTTQRDQEHRVFPYLLRDRLVTRPDEVWAADITYIPMSHGFMYLVDSWGIVYKIDVRSGTAGTIVWKMDPKEANQDRNRGVALWGNLVISVTGYEGRAIATNRDTGEVVWDRNLTDQADLELTAAPLALKDEILVGGSGGDRGLRGWLAALDPKTGNVMWKTYSIRHRASPAARPGRTRSMPTRPAAAPSTAPEPTIPPTI